jgi:Transposase DDE domain
MRKPSPARYRITNGSGHTASLNKRCSLLIWLDNEMTRLAPHDGSSGRVAVFSGAAIGFCMTIKVLFRLPSARRPGWWPTCRKWRTSAGPLRIARPNAVGRRHLPSASHFGERAGPLHLLIDGTEITAEDKGAWNAHRRRGPERRLWRKIHLGIHEQRLAVGVVEITSSDVCDVMPTIAAGSSETARDGAQTARPDTFRSGDRQCHRRKRPLDPEVRCFDRGSILPMHSGQNMQHSRRRKKVALKKETKTPKRPNML